MQKSFDQDQILIFPELKNDGKAERAMAEQKNSNFEEIDGLELSAAASKMGISIDETWKRIRNGSLLARTQQGKLFVYSNLEHLPKSPAPSEPSEIITPRSSLTETAPNIPKLPSIELSVVSSHDREDFRFLLEHLSLSKDENCQIISLTRDAMSKLSTMTETLLDMKDQIIRSKDENLNLLKEELQEKNERVLRLLKEREDLETLNQALQESLPPNDIR